ncbi:hypothetical protein BY996DRAFT_6801197 [Phakopsora pachyrhizi]|nr:hypothetical protein BY996DRAFT_6801197 [Phakopsora pachyrhizi]
MESSDDLTTPKRQSIFCKCRNISISRSDLLIIVSQALLTLSIITFYILTNFEQIALANPLAKLNKNSPRVTIFIITMISTILSITSSYFFSRAMIKLLQNQLSRPISLIKLITILEISRGKLNVKLNFLGYTALTLIFMVLLNTLTASFVALLTPMSIVVHSTVKGQELDFFSPDFDQFINSTSLFDRASQSLMSNAPTAFGPLLVSSGMSAAYSQLGFPSLLKFNDAIFNSSTGGILPVVLSGVGGHFKSLESDQRVVLGPIPQSKLNRYHVSGQAYLLRDSFSSNHTMLQQGFTADVKCRQRRVSAPDRPSLLSSPQVIDFPGTNSSDSLNYTLFRWSFDARCPDEERVNVSSLIIAIGTPFSNGGLVAVTLCPDQDLSGNKSPGNHLLTFLGAGDGYGFLDSTVCEFKTKITTVQVEYGRSIAIKNITSERKIGSENSKISRLILSLIDSMISQSQTIYTSGFGDVIKTIYNSKSSQPISTTYISSGNGANATLLNEVMEIYFKGQVEFLASYIRASFSAKDIFPNDELPINSRIDVSGRWDSETMGWDRTQKKLESGLTLIPIILVGLSSILAIIWPNPGSGIDQRESLNSKLDEFNPDNLVELLVAASIGGKYNDKDEDVEKTREIEDRFEDCEDERSSRFKNRNLEGIMGPSDKVTLLKHPNNLLWQLKLD